MRAKHLLLASLGGSSLSSAIPTALTTRQTPTGSTTRWIVGVKDASVVDIVAHAIAKADPASTSVEKWKDALLPGLVLESTLDQASLSQVDGVQHVWKSKKFTLPTPENQTITDPQALRRRQEGAPVYQAENYSTALHRSTGVDKLHQEGLFGKGIKIAVVDDGFDYNYDVLGGGIGPGFKFITGYDFNPGGPEDNDPAPDVFPEVGHGTHVSGIIAGKNDWFTGVAPEASLLAYKVFGMNHRAPDTEHIIKAWKRAYEEGADIISMSVGSPGAFSDSPLNILGDRLVEAGVVVVVSAGNDGYHGPDYVNELCSGGKTLCVASVEAKLRAADPVVFTFTTPSGQTSNVTIGHVGIGAGGLERSPVEEGSYNTGNSMGTYRDIWGTPTPVISIGDACGPLQPVAEPLHTVLLVAQAGCGMEQKAVNLRAINAKYVLYYSDGVESLQVWSESLGNGIVDKAAGEAILAVLNAQGNVTVTFEDKTNAPVVAAVHPRGGLASVYSSWGGTNDLYVKPDIAAPGGDIFSSTVWYNYNTFVDIPRGWAVYNGTSMAAPYVSGIAALYLNKYGGRDKNGPGIAQKLIDRIKASGTNVPWGMEARHDDPRNPNPVPKDAVAPVMQVGNGLIDAHKVLNYQTTLSADHIALNDTNNFAPTHQITITNAGSEPLTYEFTHEKQLGIEGRTTARHIANYIENKPIDLSPSIQLPPAITVAPGESKTATITFSPPTPTDTSKWPFYNGRVVVQANNGEELAVPYFGAAFDLKAEVSNIFQDGFPKAEGSSLEETGYEFEWNFSNGVAKATVVEVDFKTVWGTRYLRMDLFRQDWQETAWTWPPDNSEGFVGSAVFGPDDVVVDLPRSGSWRERVSSVTWRGQLAGGRRLTEGTYTVRFAMLRPFGDPAVAGDWSVWGTEKLVVVRAPAA
ncbi:peptidase S8/S53 domain-containing protein [Apiosordaria backusii]|uniref:Peptidase S8/S53 domain-containing protein n=1 Tax=Apiosordaria backusii TaxID=314023 RepID=A0AA40AN72_9PEZI|nr:peptidase S8/S53 domain-containing protein [Apiosordaria backusii]